MWPVRSRLGEAPTQYDERPQAHGSERVNGGISPCSMRSDLTARNYIRHDEPQTTPTRGQLLAVSADVCKFDPSSSFHAPASL